MLRDAGQHSGADFICIVKGPGEVGVARALELPMGTSLDDVVFGPADAQ